MDNEDEEGEDLKTVSFEVKQDSIEDIQKRFGILQICSQWKLWVLKGKKIFEDGL